ncbi:hypothetical protein BSR28_00830 [Boudabousia liubingyangii]|uniref:PP2C family protein-serine/threonine phosphatase n=1 Tax=Boudabousia liubingyangii TaxID=1921764 RepID=UPI00093C1D86|nr:protein phosphatase 2C domain-containing protein [Boudabousia liubingyangii]OKL48286.1 hypothetical protein BSR28_00830 [Boudabousia liubingyangii]
MSEEPTTGTFGGLSFAVGVVTDPGRRRPHNEDAYLAQAPWFLVADGMGGHQSGALASSAVVRAFTEVKRRVPVSERTLRKCLNAAARYTDQLSTQTFDAPGSTVSGLVFGSSATSETKTVDQLLVFNEGDSRTYRFVGGQLEQITTDHSQVQELVDAGLMTPQEARVSTSRNVITRALGAMSGPYAHADIFTIPVRVGDRFLICSDGLSDELEDQQIRALLLEHEDPQEAAHRLTKAALNAGGKDNITVLVLDLLAGAGA